LVAKEVALCAFLDIEGAFDNTSYESIQRAAQNKGIDPTSINWIKAMLHSRKISASIGDTTISVKAIKGCPQGGVLSPLLWSLVMDRLLDELTAGGYEVQGYADDLVITIRGKHDGILSARMQSALTLVRNWCLAEGLNVNPNKTIVVPFTKRRKVNLISPTVNGTTIAFSKEVRYLGVILDQRLEQLELTSGKNH
jgi:hypothetical protein